MKGKKVVFVVGAGATVADATYKKIKETPPLDRGFFYQARNTNRQQTEKVVDFVWNNYGIDLLDAKYDSLERCMAILYSDLLNPSIKTAVYSQLYNLVKLFITRLADSTNTIRPNRRSKLFGMISWLLKKELDPNKISLLTFNQDIQIEKTLYQLSRVSRFSQIAEKVFSFPNIYMLPQKAVTEPTQTKTDLFPQTRTENDGIKVLKLHGSLNWYSLHKSRNLPPTTLFNENRAFNITRRMNIDTDMTYKGRARKQYTFPIIVPPVTHKSGVLHRDIKVLWSTADARLRGADIVIVFGYSCPESDFESAALFGRCLRSIRDKLDLYIIDPNPDIMVRYAELSSVKKIYYYADPKTFLEHMKWDISLD